MQAIQMSLTRLGLIADPAAFLAVIVFTILWIVFDRESLDWHGIAALSTLLMTLLILRAEHRETQAIHAKLDELLRASGEASNELASLITKNRRPLSAIGNGHVPAVSLARNPTTKISGCPRLCASN